MIALPATPDVLIVGGGVIGCAVARALAAPGRQVVLVDRGPLGGEASGAAAGVLSVASGGEAEGPRLALRRLGLARWGDAARALADETGIDVEFERRGALRLCADERESRTAQALLAVRRQAGDRVAWWDAAAVRSAEPHVGPSMVGALHCADDAVVSCARLVAAFAASARQRGARLLPGVVVTAVERAEGRVVRVRAGGRWITPGITIFAAGAWIAAVSGAVLPVVPVRGQMLAVRSAPPLCHHVLFHAEGAVTPTRRDELLVGGTIESAGFEKAVTLAGIDRLRGDVARMLPAALRLPVVRTWCGLRPGVESGGPFIGRIAENAIVAGGHHRNGILLAPITAELVRALVDGTPPPVDPTPFAPPT